MPLAKLRRGELTTTVGTDVRCALEHALAERSLRRLLLLTDGYTGEPPDHLRAELEARRLALHVVLPSESAYRDDLERVATSLTVLPPLS